MIYDETLFLENLQFDQELTHQEMPRKFQYFKPKFPFKIETDRFIAKTADNIHELNAVFRLRNQIFLNNDCIDPFDTTLDYDEFDYDCDHIVIIDKEYHHIVGTYRILSSLMSFNFYSENEFYLDEFLSTPGVKMELGRACIHPNYRNGNVIDLLWKGIAHYSKETNSQYLFGCSSLKITDPLESKKLVNGLRMS